MLVTGCAHPTVALDHNPDSHPDKGIVFLSLTQSGTDVPISWHYRETTPDEDKKPIKGSIYSYSAKTPDFNSPVGGLGVASLPAGEYEFYKCLYGGNTYYVSKDFSIPFFIKPGTANYIGNVHIDILPRSARFKLSLFDKSDRDISLIKSKYKYVHERHIRVALSELEERYSREYGVFDKYTAPTTVYITLPAR